MLVRHIMLATASVAWIVQFPGPALAQTQDGGLGKPYSVALDINGIDVRNVSSASPVNYDNPRVRTVLVSIGPQEAGLEETSLGGYFSSTLIGYVSSSDVTYSVSANRYRSTYQPNYICSGTVPAATAGGSLSAIVNDPSFGPSAYYRSAEGDILTFSSGGANGIPGVNTGDNYFSTLPLFKVAKASGETLRYHYQFIKYNNVTHARIISVVSNFGYQIRYEYANGGSSFQSWADFDGAAYPTDIYGVNSSIVFCNPDALSCSVDKSQWPHAHLSTVVHVVASDASYLESSTITLGNGESMTYSYSPNYSAHVLTSTFTDPIGATRRFAMNYNPNTNALYALNYSGPEGGWKYEKASSWSNMTVTNPDGSHKQYTYAMTSDEQNPYSPPTTLVGNLSSVTDENGQTTTISYNSCDHVSSVRRPEGNTTSYSYDARGNLTQATVTPKPGQSGAGGVAAITQSASYPAGDSPLCAWTGSLLTISPACNRPTYIVDPNGQRTDFTYDTSTGAVLTKISPATADGIRPETRYSYVSRYAWVLNASGAYVHAEAPIHLLSSTKTCNTTATVGDACAGGASDEVITSYDYGPDQGPNNLLVRGVTVTAAGASRVRCFSYDRNGNKVSETEPNAGVASCS